MAEVTEPMTVGLTETAYKQLQELKDAGVFRDMIDAYRFAISLALSSGNSSEMVGAHSGTVFNIGSLDPDKRLFNAVTALRDPSQVEPVYKTVERLADWGVGEIYSRYRERRLDVAAILRQAEAEAR